MFRAFIQHLPAHIVNSFRGKNILWHALAIALTYGLVVSGFDWTYFEATRGDTFRSLTLPAAIIGFYVPIVLPVSLFIIGEMRRNARLMRVATALAQSAIAASLISVFYKALTGRVQPEFYTNLSNVDTSRVFNFGFYEYSIFWGWPSSHAAVAFAMSAALLTLYRNKRWLAVSAALYALYIGIGISISIHWFSDFVAGAIIGSVVGATVARSLMNTSLRTV